MSSAPELAQFYIKVHNINREIKELKEKKKTLLRRFVFENDDMKIDPLFRLMGKIFGPYLAIKWYNHVFHDDKDVVISRLEIKKLLNEEE